jgi:L-ascorbate metabolism protein UlaG (beta-lactamase superfamily)
VLTLKILPDFGAYSKGERKERIAKSPNQINGIFQNPVPTTVQVENIDKWKLLRELFRRNTGRVPSHTIPVRQISPEKELIRKNDLKVTWLGHSTLLLEMNGFVVLTDPVFSHRTSPFAFIGTKHFKFSHTFSVTDLPPVDLVLISHDHYDHLDYQTILRLKNKVPHFVMPLGVGAHLERWGVPPGKIKELDWWEDLIINTELKLTATPARHFSARGLTDRFHTLWASFVLEWNGKTIFFGGDSGYHPLFKTIGERFGPFDLCMLECGQFNENWPFIHSMPEETAQACTDLDGKILLPVHWGKFSLSLHHWTEPIERIIKASEKHNYKLVTPQIGESFFAGSDFPKLKWWKND